MCTVLFSDMIAEKRKELQPAIFHWEHSSSLIKSRIILTTDRSCLDLHIQHTQCVAQQDWRVLKFMRMKKMIQNAAAMGKYVTARAGNETKHPSIGDFRTTGLLGCFELVKTAIQKEPMAPFNAKPDEMAVMNKVAAKIKELGMYTFVRWNYILLLHHCASPESKSMRDWILFPKRSLLGWTCELRSFYSFSLCKSNSILENNFNAFAKSGKEPLDRSLHSEDLAPITQDQRTWNTWNYAALWSAWVCVSPYMLAVSIEGGMNWAGYPSRFFLATPSSWFQWFWTDMQGKMEYHSLFCPCQLRRYRCKYSGNPLRAIV